MTAIALAVTAAARGGAIADVPPNPADEDDVAYGQYNWPAMTALLNADASTPIATIPDLSNLQQMMQYSGLWVDARSVSMSAAELSNLQTYIASGRRVVMIGGNYYYGAWDSSILSAVGGSFNSNSNTNSYSLTIPNNTAPTVLTAGVSSLTAFQAGYASPGTASGIRLFDQPVATLWGPADNAVVYLNSIGFASGFNTDFFVVNNGFAQNVANWINGNLSAGSAHWSTAAPGSWTAGASWSTGIMPSSGDDVQFPLAASGATVTVAAPVACRNLNISSSRITIDLPSAGGLTAYGAITVTGSSALSLTRSWGGSTAAVAAASVNVAAGSILSAGAGITVSSPVISGDISIAGSTGDWTGTLDVGTGSADLTGAALAVVTDQVRQGYNLAAGGGWNGSGVTSSAAASDTTHLHAVGVMAGAANDVIASYTFFGDANLDGKVDGSDYTLIDVGSASHGRLTGWSNGDFNYDGVIDGSDYALIDNAFNNQGTATPAVIAEVTTQVAAVPEPVGITGITLVVALPGRRRVRRPKPENN